MAINYEKNNIYKKLFFPERSKPLWLLFNIFSFYVVLYNFRYSNFDLLTNIHYLFQILSLLFSYLLTVLFLEKFQKFKTAKIFKRDFIFLIVWLAGFSIIDFIFKLDSSRFLVFTSIFIFTAITNLQISTKNHFQAGITGVLGLYLIFKLLLPLIPENPENLKTISNLCKSSKGSESVIQICEEIPQLLLTNDVESASLIRDYFHKNILVQSGVREVQIKQRPTDIQGWTSVYSEGAAGSMCGDLSSALSDVFREFGLESYTYNFGKVETTATHVVTIIKLGRNYYLQDATFNYDIRDTKTGKQIPIDEALELIEQLSLDSIFASENQATYKRIVGEDALTETDKIEYECAPTSDELHLCEKFMPPRVLDSLNSDERYTNALEEVYPKLIEEKDPLKFLVLMNEPIGNNPEVTCKILKNC